MKSNSDIIIALVLLAGYCYTLIYAHFLLINADKRTNIRMHSDGQTKIKDIRISGFAGSACGRPETKKAMLLLKLNYYIVYAFFGLLIYSLIFGDFSHSRNISALHNLFATKPTTMNMIMNPSRVRIDILKKTPYIVANH
jgi:hypothetical protein